MPTVNEILKQKVITYFPSNRRMRISVFRTFFNELIDAITNQIQTISTTITVSGERLNGQQQSFPNINTLYFDVKDFTSQPNQSGTQVNLKTKPQIIDLGAEPLPTENIQTNKIYLKDGVFQWWNGTEWVGFGGDFIEKVTSTDNAIVRFNSTTGEVQNSQVFIDDNGKIGLNTATPKALINAVCKSSGFPMAGVVDDKTAMFIADQSNSYGLLAGVHHLNGNSWMQAQRTDGNTTLYNILLQPIGGNVLIGSTGSPEGVLDVRSTTKGSLPYPRMTQAQRLAIVTPAAGVHVYQTDATEGVYVYKSTGWKFAY